MNRKIRYSHEPLGKVAVVEDFLPPPDQLAFREETVRVVITLKKASDELFRREAERQGVPYQAMIRKLLDAYAQRFEQPAEKAAKSRK